MAKFAIIKLGTNQVRLEEGKTYDLPRFSDSDSKKFTVTEVLAAGDDKGAQFGMPFLDKAKVEVEVVGNANGEKVTSRIYKAKSRYRRTRGFRKKVTTIKVSSISF